MDHILPVMTQPFDFRRRKSVVPEWEEQILFNERFSHFLQQDECSPKVLLLFEVGAAPPNTFSRSQLHQPPPLLRADPGLRDHGGGAGQRRR